MTVQQHASPALSKGRVSLKKRLLIPFLIIGIVTSSLCAFKLHNDTRRTIEDKIAKRATLIANSINYAAETESTLSAFQRFVSALGASREIKLITVVGGEPGVVIASSRNAWIGSSVLDIPDSSVREALLQVSDSQQTYFSIRPNEHNRLEMGVPLLVSNTSIQTHSLSRGAVLLHLDTTHISEDTTANTLNIAATLAGSLLLFGAAFYWFFHRHVLQPLNKLKAAIRAQAEGETDARAPIEYNDELGQVALHFNQLIEKLAEHEHERQKSAEQFRMIFEHSRDALFLIRRHKIILTNNAAAEMVRAQGVEAMLGHHPVEFSPSLQPSGRSSHEHFEAALSNAKQSNSARTQMVLLRDDKTLFPAEVTLTCLPDSEGDLMLLVWRDLSEEKEHERSLRSAKEQAERTLTELSNLKYALDQHAIVAITNADGELEYVNQRFCEISGFSEGDLIGKDHNILKSGHHTQEFYRGIWKTIHSGRVWRGEVCNRAKNGSLYWVDTTIVPLTNQSGTIVQFIAIRTDITKLKLTEGALLSAKQSAEKADRAKSAFLATMSHEIRTPMNGVIGMTYLLMDTQLDNQQRDYTQTIKNCGENLLTIINEILDYSKIEAGKLELEEVSFDLRKCVEECLDVVAPAAIKKDIELAYMFDDNVPAQISTDVTRVRQILSNLLNNAVKFTSDGGEVVVTVRAIREQENKSGSPVRLYFAVRDNGIGIAPERQNRLFKPFSQVDSSTTRQFGGTGLGLTICKKLSELLGGDIEVDSKPGEGSTFLFHILAETRPQIIRRQLTERCPVLEGKHILIVDDNNTNRQILEHQSRRWGLLPTLVDSPAAALLEIERRETPFPLAIIDYRMPEMNGEQLAAQIRRIPGYETAFLLLFSSIGEHQRSPFFNACLNKPIKPFQILDTLIQHFGRPAHSIAKEASPPAPGSPNNENESNPLTILLAEDNVVNQKVARLLLKRLGHDAEVVSSGTEAVDAVHRRQYDLVLMDVNMPEMDGYEATRIIRRTVPPNRRPRIVAVTAAATNEDQQKATAAGMDGHLPKPIREDQLKMLIDSCLASAKRKKDNGENDTGNRSAS